MVASFRVLELVTRSKCSAYGCEFVALAQDLNLPLITTDNQILTSFPQLAVSLKSVPQ
jgi:predicted nucleic acid-binding protein